MTNTPMTPDRFQAILDAYGAEPRRWPDAERDAALAFMAADPRAKALMEAERGLDAMLDLLADPVADSALIDRVIAGMTAPLPTPDPHRHQAMWAGLGIAASLVISLAGVLLGAGYSLNSLSDVRAQTVLEQTAMIDTE